MAGTNVCVGELIKLSGHKDKPLRWSPPMVRPCKYCPTLVEAGDDSRRKKIGQFFTAIATVGLNPKRVSLNSSATIK